MDHHRDLQIILEAIAAIERLASQEARLLDPHELSELTRLSLEAKQVLDSELGFFNDFSSSIQSELRKTEFTFMDRPGPGTARRLHELVLGGTNQIHRKAAQPQKRTVADPSSEYVSPSRIAELRALPKGPWDLKRLVRLAEELNLASRAQCHMATAMLVRAIADHVPPIFGYGNFDQVANNLPTGKSVKSSLQKLQGSLRNIADAHLHLQIRAQESLPAAQQVDFRQDLDVLLAEVVRVLR